MVSRSRRRILDLIQMVAMSRYASLISSVLSFVCHHIVNRIARCAATVVACLVMGSSSWCVTNDANRSYAVGL